MSNRKLPQFKDEAEEARWWYEHRDDVATEIVKTSRKGRTGPGSVSRLRAKLRAQATSQTEKGTLASTGNRSK
jgi:hypothetical protein